MRDSASMTRLRMLLQALAMSGLAIAAQATGISVAGADGWISHPQAAAQDRPIVLQFRRVLDLPRRPASFVVRVSADNRFILFANGRRVAAGPSTSDIAHWRYETIDLASYLQPGRNEISATVWNEVQPPLPAVIAELTNQTGRLAQQSLATGFWLQGDAAAVQIGTAQAGWQVAIDRGRSPVNGVRQFGFRIYYVAGAPEEIDTRTALSAWIAAVPTDAAARPLVVDPLPAQRFQPAAAGRVVRTTLAGGSAFPARSVTVPPHSHVSLLLQRSEMISAYPELQIKGGKDARIQITYAEALYDSANRKGDRDSIDDRRAIGIHDTLIADGATRAVMPLWWRTWRYLDLNVETGDAPLTLVGLKVWETGYPFEQRGYFRSSDPVLDRIWQVGWRTAQVDAHDTYMDSSYWEQLQYVGDTRLQMLISYAVAGDPRLARQALDAFAASDVDGGLTEGAWPSRGSNAIAPFALLWVGMLHDWWLEQPDAATVARNLPRMRRVLAWFVPWLGPNGLLTKNPQWNFVDWVGQPATDRSIFPSYGRDGESCLISIFYLGALDQAADLEVALGDTALGARDRAQASVLRDAIRARCWSPERRLFADDPDQATFSQHMNALAVLYDVVPRGEARELLERITVADKGIDAPVGMTTTSYYFAWYLIRAFEHAGLAQRYPALLATWADLLKLHYTTWPESRGDTRSDTHAWSAHPTADLLRLVAGIGPAAPGYARVRIAPALGMLTRLDAAAATPQGTVRVRYRKVRGKLQARIVLPPGLSGSFLWDGREYPLTRRTTSFSLPAR
jgi:alpha-L-rhamnosidase